MAIIVLKIDGITHIKIITNGNYRYNEKECVLNCKIYQKLNEALWALGKYKTAGIDTLMLQKKIILYMLKT